MSAQKPTEKQRTLSSKQSRTSHVIAALGHQASLPTMTITQLSEECHGKFCSPVPGKLLSVQRHFLFPLSQSLLWRLDWCSWYDCFQMVLAITRSIGVHGTIHVEYTDDPVTPCYGPERANRWLPSEPTQSTLMPLLLFLVTWLGTPGNTCISQAILTRGSSQSTRKPGPPGLPSSTAITGSLGCLYPRQALRGLPVSTEPSTPWHYPPPSSRGLQNVQLLADMWLLTCSPTQRTLCCDSSVKPIDLVKACHVRDLCPSSII